MRLDELGLTGELQGHLDHLLDVLGVEPQVALGVVEPVQQLADLLFEIPLELEQLPDRFDLGFRLAGVEPDAPAQHGLLDLLGDHRTHFAEVFPDCLDLADGSHQELQVGFKVADLRLLTIALPVVVPLADEVVDEHALRSLPVPVDTAVALFEAVRVPGDLEVDHPGAVVLKVDAFGSGVGGQQDADGTVLGVGLEGRLDPLPVLRVHAAVHRHEAVAAGEPLRSQNTLEPVLGVPVLGEDDDSLVAPGTVGTDVLVEPADQPLGLGVELRGCLAGPGLHFLEQSHSSWLGSWKSSAAASNASWVASSASSSTEYSSSTRSIWR